MLYWDDVQTPEKLVQLLQQDEVIISSGDTVLGLWGNITQTVFQKINVIKQRNEKPYLLVIASKEKLPLFIDQHLTDQMHRIIETYWPGPLTLIFKARADLPAWLQSSDGTIALRVPDHAGFLKVLHHFDALFSTSVNITGHPIPESVEQIDADILRQVGAICAQSGQLIYPQTPSTILDCSKGTVQLIRSGAIPMDKINQLLG